MKIAPKQFVVLGLLVLFGLAVLYDAYDRRRSLQQLRTMEAENAADVARFKREIERLQDELDELKK
jgi:hypothetical protein